MTYQRGTDLKHCPDDCGCLGGGFKYGERDALGLGRSFEQYEFYCRAIYTDTCPREQAEKLKEKRSAEICASCFYDQSIHRCAACPRPRKERTNG